VTELLFSEHKLVELLHMENTMVQTDCVINVQIG